MLGILQDLDNSTANDLKNKISRMVKMGRSINCYVWVGVQTAYKELFSSNSSSGGSSRESFTHVIALGTIDEQQKQMLFSLYKHKMISEKGEGQGYMYINGIGFDEIEVARIEDFNSLTGSIRKALGGEKKDCS